MLMLSNVDASNKISKAACVKSSIDKLFFGPAMRLERTRLEVPRNSSRSDLGTASLPVFSANRRQASYMRFLKADLVTSRKHTKQ